MMLEKATRLGIFTGFKVGHPGMEIDISHLQFADDLLVFCGGEERQVRNVKRCLARLDEILWGVGGFICIASGPADVSPSLEWNEVIFEGIGVDWLQIEFLVKFRLAMWLKAKFPRACVSVEQLLTDFSLVSNLITSDKASTSNLQGRLSPRGFLKLNIDGAVNRWNLKSGIGGLIRDDLGTILSSQKIRQVALLP
ncbi:hypothetical protein V6N11_065346 [Hibiscus sabdariffa]|uniref:Reverse transcriptase domain-containing protein n=1 Tax=Hibiscus sabdariffa TaxID=183260 RepID=A0ABR2QGR5_9ROSI